MLLLNRVFCAVWRQIAAIACTLHEHFAPCPAVFAGQDLPEFRTASTGFHFSSFRDERTL
jgi:hypothetical protein